MHGYIEQISYPYWSYYGTVGNSQTAGGDPWYNYACDLDLDGINESTCTAYYSYAGASPYAYPWLTVRSSLSSPSCYGSEEGWRWYGWTYDFADSKEFRYFPFHIKLGYSVVAGQFTTPVWAKLFESDELPAAQRGWA